jgi:hypothetical protein
MNDIQIKIKGKTKKFDPEHQEWMHQSHPLTQFTLCKVGRHKCFVKRQPKPFSGWNLLSQCLQKQQIRNTPDILSLSQVNGHHYYFAQQLRGDILEKKRGNINPAKLIKAVFTATYVINHYGYWYSDLCTKNIFVTDRGEYYLIDIDSARPHNQPFHNRMGVSYEYAALLPYFAKQTRASQCSLVKGHNGQSMNQAMIIALAVDAKYGFKIPMHAKATAPHNWLMKKHKQEYVSLFSELAKGQTDWAATKKLTDKIIAE